MVSQLTAPIMHKMHTRTSWTYGHYNNTLSYPSRNVFPRLIALFLKIALRSVTTPYWMPEKSQGRGSDYGKVSGAAWKGAWHMLCYICSPQSSTRTLHAHCLIPATPLPVNIHLTSDTLSFMTLRAPTGVSTWETYRCLNSTYGRVRYLHGYLIQDGHIHRGHTGYRELSGGICFLQRRLSVAYFLFSSRVWVLQEF